MIFVSMERTMAYPQNVAAPTCLTPEQVLRVYGQIEAKRRARRHLRSRPLLLEQVS